MSESREEMPRPRKAKRNRSHSQSCKTFNNRQGQAGSSPPVSQPLQPDPSHHITTLFSPDSYRYAPKTTASQTNIIQIKPDTPIRDTPTHTQNHACTSIHSQTNVRTTTQNHLLSKHLICKPILESDSSRH